MKERDIASQLINTAIRSGNIVKGTASTMSRDGTVRINGVKAIVAGYVESGEDVAFRADDGNWYAYIVGGSEVKNERVILNRKARLEKPRSNSETLILFALTYNRDIGYDHEFYFVTENNVFLHTIPVSYSSENNTEFYSYGQIQNAPYGNIFITSDVTNKTNFKVAMSYPKSYNSIAIDRFDLKNASSNISNKSQILIGDLGINYDFKGDHPQAPFYSDYMSPTLSNCYWGTIKNLGSYFHNLAKIYPNNENKNERRIYYLDSEFVAVDDSWNEGRSKVVDYDYWYVSFNDDSDVSTADSWRKATSSYYKYNFNHNLQLLPDLSVANTLDENISVTGGMRVEADPFNRKAEYINVPSGFTIYPSNRVDVRFI